MIAPAAFAKPTTRNPPMRNIIVLVALLLCAAGQAQTVDICDRTQQVRDAILEVLGAADCAAVDSSGLTSLQSLNLRDKAWRTRENVDALYGRQRGYCAECGNHYRSKDMRIDHITPRSKGGGKDARGEKWR